MSPLKSDTTTSEVTSKRKTTSATNKKQTSYSTDVNVTRNDIKKSSSTHNGIPTPPLIKINRKYSRLSSNSSYESSSDSRSCSSTSSNSSRSRSMSVESNLSAESSTGESAQLNLSILSDSTSNQKLKAETLNNNKRLKKPSNHHSSRRHHHNRKQKSKTKSKSKSRLINENKSSDKSSNLESGDEEEEEDLEEGDEEEEEEEENDNEDDDDQNEEHETENELDEMSISELEKLTKHELILDDDEYDHIKQMLVNLSWCNQYKFALINSSNQNSLMLTEKDQIGFWLAKPTTNHHSNTNTNGAKHHHHHHHHSHYYGHTTGSLHGKSHLHSHNSIASNSFKNFNDWRSHLMYYKQVKGYNHSLPGYLKANNFSEKRPTNNLPIIEKYSNNDQTKFLTNENSRMSFSNFSSSYLVSQSGLFPNTSYASALPPPPAPHKLLASQSNANLPNALGSQTNSQKLDSSQSDTLSPQASTSNMSTINKRIKNIDFKIDSSMRRLLEANQPILSQKLLPTTRMTKSIAGSLRLLPKETSKTPQHTSNSTCTTNTPAAQYQISSQLFSKIISSSSNSSPNTSINSNSNQTTSSDSGNFVLNMTSLDEKFVKDFTNKNNASQTAGLNNNLTAQTSVSNTISEPGKRVIAFYHRVNENDYSVKMQDYTLSTKASNSSSSNNNQDNLSASSMHHHNHELVRWSKLTRPTLPANLASIINNAAKSPTTNQAAVNAHISNSLVNKKFNNLSNIQNRLQAQHQQLILHQQLNNTELANRIDSQTVDAANGKSDSIGSSSIPAASAVVSNAINTTTNVNNVNSGANSNVTNSGSSSNDVIITATTSNSNSTTRFANFLNQPVKFQIAN